MPRTLIFDVNETLSDPTPLADTFASVGATSVTPSTWLAATLRDGFALSLTTGAEPFPEVAEQVLLGLLSAEPKLSSSIDDAVEQVMAVFTDLPVHDDVVAGLRNLQTQGHRLVTLSNGSSDYARALLQRAGVDDGVSAFLSVDEVGAWKPDRRAYEHALTHTGTSAADAVLIAVHPWDLHGARAAGLATVHLDRASTPWPSTFAGPDVRITSLTELQLP